MRAIPGAGLASCFGRGSETGRSRAGGDRRDARARGRESFQGPGLRTGRGGPAGLLGRSRRSGPDRTAAGGPGHRRDDLRKCRGPRSDRAAFPVRRAPGVVPARSVGVPARSGPGRAKGQGPLRHPRRGLAGVSRACLPGGPAGERPGLRKEERRASAPRDPHGSGLGGLLSALVRRGPRPGPGGVPVPFRARRERVARGRPAPAPRSGSEHRDRRVLALPREAREGVP